MRNAHSAAGATESHGSHPRGGIDTADDLGKRSAVEAAVLSLFVGIASSAAWDAMKAWHPNARRRAEHDARQALVQYRASLDWAEDTDHEDDAHRRLDDAGGWVRRTFGATSGGTAQYRQRCPVALGRNRIGLSVGGRAAKQVCSPCGMDLSECEHLPGTAYLVPGGAGDLGWCRVCCASECDHLPHETYRASLVSIIQGMDLDEVSIVTKPAHPEARIQAVSIPESDLQASLGR